MMTDPPEMPTAAAEAWADVYIDVVEKLEAEEQSSKAPSAPATDGNT